MARSKSFSYSGLFFPDVIRRRDGSWEYVRNESGHLTFGKLASRKNRVGPNLTPAESEYIRNEALAHHTPREIQDRSPYASSEERATIQGLIDAGFGDTDISEWFLA